MLELESSIPSGPFARAFTRSFDEIGDVYQMAFHGVDRIANREAIRMAVMPQDGDRYGYRLWIDTATGLLLRSELVDGNGARLEIFQFATLEVGGPIDGAVFDMSSGESSVVSHLTLGPHSQPRLEGGEMHWEAAWLPQGFAMASWDIRRTPSTLKSINTLMYSDGLAAFSVFIEAMPPAGAGEMTSRHGATVAVTNLILGPDDERHLVTRSRGGANGDGSSRGIVGPLRRAVNASDFSIRHFSIRQGRVTRVEEHGCWVEFASQRCANCTGRCGQRFGDDQLLWIENAGPAFPQGSVVDVGVPRSHLSRVVLMLLGVPTLALIVTGLAHRALDPLATETALALTGFAVFSILLVVLARIAAHASAALSPRILNAPVEPVAVRLLNNRRIKRS